MSLFRFTLYCSLSLSLFLCLGISNTIVNAASLRPVTVDQFFFDPESNIVLAFNVDDNVQPDSLEYLILDSQGRPLADSQGIATQKDDQWEVTVRLPQGFWEIQFQGTGQRFGLVALESAPKPQDMFFAIDGALSWLVHDDTVREGLVKTAARIGIGTSRERIRWNSVNPQKDVWDFETSDHYDMLRKTYEKYGIEVLDVAHDSPKWLDPIKVYPKNLVEAGKSFSEIARRWNSSWAGLEIWNEPDIFFGGNLPADQYVPLLQAIAYRLQKDGTCSKPIISGVLAHFNGAWIENAAKCGILDDSDYFSFHTYLNAPDVEHLFGEFRNWLVENGHPQMPLWLTECGRPWKLGSERPNADQDTNSACDITMKGVEARCCGIDRYFPFVYPYYEENDNNFGMIDKRGSPLRAIAAYAQLIRVLSHKTYIGDFKLNNPAVLRGRMFASPEGEKAKEVVLVLYTGKAEQETTVKLPFEPIRVETLTGEIVPQPERLKNQVIIQSGLVYVFWTNAQLSYLSQRWDRETNAMKLYRLGQNPPVRVRESGSPIVLTYQVDLQTVEPSSQRYAISEKAISDDLTFPIIIRASNLADSEQNIQLTCNSTGSLQPEVKNVNIPAQESVDVSLTGMCPKRGHLFSATIQAKEGEKVLRTLVLNFERAKK